MKHSDTVSSFNSLTDSHTMEYPEEVLYFYTFNSLTDSHLKFGMNNFKVGINLSIP